MVMFDSIAVKNINTFKYQEFDFNDITNCMVIGKNKDSEISESNGSGKSTLFSDALIYAIYGKSDRNLRNKYAKKEEESYVEVKFYFKNDFYVIKRFANDPKNKNKVEIYVNDSPLHFNTLRESNMFISRIFTLSYENFISSIIFKQGFEVKLSQLTPVKRKEYFYSVIDYDFDLIVDKIKKDIKILDAEIDDVFSLYVKLKSEISYLQGKLDILNSQFKDININEIENEINNLNEIVENLSKKKKELEFMLNLLNIEKMTEYDNYIKHISKVKNEIENLTKLKNGVCPLCGNKIDIKNVEYKINKLKKELSKVFIFSKDKELIDIESELKNINLELDKYNERLKELNVIKLNTINLVEDKNKILKEIEDKNKEFEEVSFKLEELKQNKKDLEGFMKLILPSGKLRTLLLSYYLEIYNNILSNIINSLFSEFTNVKLSMSEDMKGIIMEGIDYKSLSGGEKRRFDFVLQLAFSDFITYINNFDCNIRILDESFDTLDKSSIIHILDYVKEVFCNKKIICISHNDDLKTFFDNVVYVVKENNESKIVGE